MNHDLGISVHDSILNAALLETNPDKALEVARSAREEIERIRETRRTYHRIRWLPEMSTSSRQPIEEHNYLPRVAVLAGAFDVAALFLSPRLENAPWLQTGPLMIAGQDLSCCFLLKAESLGFRPESDFNRDFIDAYRQDVGDNLESDAFFLAVTKLKLNPLLTWPKSQEGSLEEGIRRLRHTLRPLWKVVADWTRAHPNGGRPIAALGLACGWNEILIAAHADHPGKLLELSVRLRQQAASTESGEQVHVALTNLTALGHDYRAFTRAAKAFFRCRARSGKIPSAGTLVRLAREIAHQIQPEASRQPDGVFYQLGCHTYPGHERSILKLFDEVARELGDSVVPANTSSFEIGKRDIWSPQFRLGESLPPIAGSLLIALLRMAVRDLWSSGRPANAGTIPNAFDFFSRFGFLAASGGHFSLAELPPNHARGLPRERLGGPAMQRMIDSVQTGREPSLLSRVRRALRVLQVPYALSEQVFHVFNTFFWAHDRETLWDESIEIVPVLLALTRSLEARARWWEDDCPVAIGESAGGEGDQFEQAWLAQVTSELESFLDPELLRALSSFRGVHANRHLSNYLTDGTPDLNLRYRGSVQQLMCCTQMILDLLASRLLGPERACLAGIGDSTSPEVFRACTLTIVNLNGDTFLLPFMLESLAHEVGHEFLRELIQDLQDPNWRRYVGLQEWKGARQDTIRDLRLEISNLNRLVFFGRLFDPCSDGANKFVESAADFLEMRSLGYAGLQEWAQSFLLRSVMGSLPVTRPSGTERPRSPDGPAVDERVILSAIIRVVLVACAETLCNLAPEDASRIEILQHAPLANVRRLLRETCVLGSSAQAFFLLEEDEEWNKFLETYIAELPWLRAPIGLEQAARFYECLDEHANGDFETSTDDAARVQSELWEHVRSALGGLRQRLLQGVTPSLFVRSRMSPHDRSRARSQELSPREMHHTTSVLPQPFSLAAELLKHRSGDTDSKLRKVQSILFQRGALVPATAETSHKWAAAEREFWVALLVALPTWRSNLLQRVEGMLEDQGT